MVLVGSFIVYLCPVTLQLDALTKKLAANEALYERDRAATVAATEAAFAMVAVSLPVWVAKRALRGCTVAEVVDQLREQLSGDKEFMDDTDALLAAVHAGTVHSRLSQMTSRSMPRLSAILAHALQSSYAPPQ